MTIKVPLHAVAHGRAGDKGNRSSISVIPFYSDAYKHIVFQITEDIVFQLFRHKGATAVRRYELPKLPALNFVIDDALEGGVNGSLSVDSHGKTLSFFLLGELTVTVPESCLPNNSPYLGNNRNER